ncbi:ATP-grasp domain-containing protein [Pseudonocardia sp. WMMC193]|uniref:ATP-grasp domain-containing protein n=1 Tax=Pseudonocardia sp. WMMC193 TaxID=2911965 RepID=UPI001F2E670B|nr:ATP-grasp domain-containing protein [Pseudonocardia sp. WMMC193]MCF7551758.1 ATP-grasp domain-containing protein [Pseudonocardia sp. WMMC193]
MLTTVPTTAPHVLVVGTGQDFPARIRTAAPDARISVLCRAGGAARVQNPDLVAEIVEVTPGSAGEDWMRLAKAVHAAHPVTRVAAFGELDQDHAAAIGRALDVPATAPETVALVHDKAAMRARLRSAGVDPTPSELVDGPDGIVAFLARHGGPCVVKPVQGAGSAGVAVVDGPERAEAAYALATTPFDGIPPAGVLVERFHTGPQYSVESFSAAGEHEIVAVVRKFSDPATAVELGHVTPPPEPVGPEVPPFVRGVLDALGVRDGPTHTELVLTVDGPRVVETHVRLAGDEIPELVRIATGVDLAEATARHAVGHTVLPEIRAARRPGPRAAVWFALPPAGGTLRALSAGDAVPLLDPGDPIAEPLNSDSRLAYALAGGADALEVARRRAESVRALVDLAPVRPTRLL